MDAKQQTLELLNRIWVKLQGLPSADPVELGAFFIILTFIFMVVFMMAVTCTTCCCCCCRRTEMKGSNV